MSPKSSHTQMISDGAGGAYMVYDSTVAAGGYRRIFAKRMDGHNSVIWGPVAVSPGYYSGFEKGEVFAGSDGAGGVIVGWFNESGVAYAQRYSPAGAAQWTAGGVQISTGAAIDGGFKENSAGGFFAFFGYYSGSSIVGTVQSVNNSGQCLWPHNAAGNCVSASTGTVLFTDLQGDGQGAGVDGGSGSLLFVVGGENGGKLELYGYKVAANGTLAWGKKTLSATSGDEGNNVEGISDGSGGAYIVWTSSTGGAQALYTRRFDANGNAYTGWASALQLTDYYNTERYGISLAKDEDGFAVLYSTSNDGQGGELRIVRASATVSALASGWTLNGKLAGHGRFEDDTLVYDGSAYHFVWSGWAWPYNSVHYQKMAKNCEFSYPDGYIAVAAPNHLNIAIASDGLGGALAGWKTNIGGGDVPYLRRMPSDAALRTLEDFVNYLQVNADTATITAKIINLADKLDVKFDTATLASEIGRLTGKYNDNIADLRYRIITGAEVFTFLGKTVDPHVAKSPDWTWSSDEFYAGMSTYTWGGLFPAGMPQSFIDVLDPVRILTEQQAVDDFIEYLRVNAATATITAQITDLADKLGIKIDTAAFAAELGRSARTYDKIDDLQYKIITGTSVFTYMGKPVDPNVVRVATWTWSPVEFYTGMSTYTWGGLFPAGMPQDFVDFLDPAKLSYLNLVDSNKILHPNQQAIDDFISYLQISSDTATITIKLTELAAELGIQVDTAAFAAKMGGSRLYDEIVDLHYKIVKGTEAFTFLKVKVNPSVTRFSTWTWNAGDFYTGMSTYTWGGLFPDGMPQGLIDMLAPDMIINDGLSPAAVKSYLRDIKANEYKAILSANPNDPDANFGLALIETDEFVEKNHDNFNTLVVALSSGNLSEVYRIYKSTGFSGTLSAIKSRLDIVKKADFFWFTVVARHTADGAPFVIKAGEDILPASIPSPFIDLLAGAVDLIRAAGEEADSLVSEFTKIGPYIFDLNPNKLDFSKAKDPQGYIDALRASNLNFLAMKTPLSSAATMKSYGDKLAANLEKRIKALKGLRSFLNGINSKVTFTGLDEPIAFAETCLQDLRYPALYTVIDGRIVNFSAWFDDPPANLLATIEKDINKTDVTLAGFFPGNAITGLGYVTGNVTRSAGGTALNGALVEAFHNGVVVSSATTGADGNYTLELATGTRNLRAGMAGYFPKTAAAVVLGGKIVTLDFALEAAASSGTIAGRVFKSDGSTGLPDALVRIFRGDVLVNSAATNSSGYYSVDIATGDYTLEAGKSGYETKTARAAVISGQTTSVNFTLKATFGSISGKVVLKTSTTTALAGIHIEARAAAQPGTVAASTITAADGTYAFALLPAGNYLVGVARSEEQGYVNVYYNDKTDRFTADPVTVAPEAATPNINFALPRMGKISGVVKDQWAADFAGVKVEAIEKEWKHWGTMLTSSTGYYEIVGLPAGEYIVRATDDNGGLNPGAKPVYFDNKTTWAAAYKFGIGADAVISTANFVLNRDTVPPTGILLIDQGASSTTSRAVALTVTGTDTISGVDRMRFSNTGTEWTTWIAYSTAPVYWQLAGNIGENTVYLQLRDKAGNVSLTITAVISSYLPPLHAPVEIICTASREGQWWVKEGYRWINGDWWSGWISGSVPAFYEKKPGLTTLSFFSRPYTAPPPDIACTFTTDDNPSSLTLLLSTASFQLTKGDSTGGRQSWSVTIPSADVQRVWQNDPSWIWGASGARMLITPAVLEIVRNGETRRESLPPFLITRTDPSGYVTNSSNNEPIAGATVTLYYFNTASSAFEFADPNFVGITPEQNPLYTDSDGFYRWDVEDGRYYVKVEAPWYQTVAQSNIVTIPPPVTDLNIQMTSIDVTPPAGSVVVSGGQYTESPVVNLVITSTDTESQVKAMRLSQRADFAGAVWEAIVSSRTTKQFTLLSADGSGKQFKLSAETGLKTVYAQFKDVNGNISTVTVNAALVSSTLDGAHPYPNPFKPNSGLNHTGITFTGLPAKVRLRIFNLAGEMIYDAEQATNGTLPWDAKNMSGGKAASGVYIYYLTQPGTGYKKKGKLAIIR